MSLTSGDINNALKDQIEQKTGRQVPRNVLQIEKFVNTKHETLERLSLDLTV